MSYIGNEPVVSATRTITEITATAGQTVFVANGGYTVGFIDVFVNGAQLQTSDFTATNGSTVTLSSAASVGDDVRLVAWGTFSTGAITPAALSTPNAVYWDGSGNVGIGTTSPAVALDISNTANSTSGQLRIASNGSNGTRMGFISTSTNGKTYQIGSNFITGTGEFGVYDATSAATRFLIDSSGNVGIGTTSPTNFGSNFRLMEVKGTDYGVIQATSTSGSTTIEMMGASGTGYLSTRTNHPLVFRTNDTERMRLTTGGQLLINQTGSYFGREKLAIYSTTSEGITCQIEDTTYGQVILKSINAGSSTHYMMQFRAASGSTIGQITHNETNCLYTNFSDYRLKENVVPMQNALDKVALLKPVTYTWKSSGIEGQGFIAHELQSVVPDCVSGEKDAVDAKGNPVYQGVDTSFLVATLTAAIQELNAKVDAQALEIAALKGNV